MQICNRCSDNARSNPDRRYSQPFPGDESEHRRYSQIQLDKSRRSKNPERAHSGNGTRNDGPNACPQSRASNPTRVRDQSARNWLKIDKIISTVIEI